MVNPKYHDWENNETTITLKLVRQLKECNEIILFDITFTPHTRSQHAQEYQSD